jgi:hypothetical protein
MSSISHIGCLKHLLCGDMPVNNKIFVSRKYGHNVKISEPFKYLSVLYLKIKDK